MTSSAQFACAAFAVLSIACSGPAIGTGAGPAASPNGDGLASIAGSISKAPAVATSVRYATSVVLMGPWAVIVDVTNEADVCGTIVNGGGFPKGATVLQLIVTSMDTPAVPGPGTYTINAAATSGTNADVEFLSLADTSCTAIASAAPAQSSGTVTLTTVSTTEVSGSFDVTLFEFGLLQNRDHLTGQFTAPACLAQDPAHDPAKCGGLITP